MELLRFTYHNAYTIQASSTDIGRSWRKFKVRANYLPPDKYCSYAFAKGGDLQVFNAETNTQEPVPESEWCQTRPVFFETQKYNLSITFYDAKTEPKIIHPNKDVEALFNIVETASKEYIVSGSLDFLNQPGHFAMEFAYTNANNENIRHKVEFDVLSPKLDTKNDLNIITSQLKAEFGNLVFRYLTLTFQQYELGREVKNELIWLAVFKQIVDNYVMAVRFIIHQPHNKNQQYEEYRRAERIKKWSPLLLIKFSNDRKENEDSALRKYYRTEQTESTLDTRENRFVKYTLQRIYESLSSLIKQLGKGTSDNEIAFFKDKLSELNLLRQNSFFKNIGLFDGFRQQSMVLQQRSGYSQVYRYWIMLQNGLDLIQGETSIGVQPIWKLYELWCFLKFKQLVCEVLELDPLNPQHARDFIKEHTHNAFDLFEGGSLSGNITYINPRNGDEIEVGYQYSFSRNGQNMRSATTVQKPDIVMHIHKIKQGITLTYLYDAKYSVLGDDDDTLGDALDEPKPETINAMHHYRDAIYYGKRGELRFSKEIIGGYILFPGRINEMLMQEKIEANTEEGLPYFLRSIKEVNIGAFPLLPNEESGLLLKHHLKKVLLNETIAEQLDVSVPQRGLQYQEVGNGNGVALVMLEDYDTRKNGFVNGKVAIPVKLTESGMNLLENQANIAYVLFHTRNKDENKHFFKAQGIVRVFSKDEAEKEEYYLVQSTAKRYICVRIDITKELDSTKLNPSKDNIPYNDMTERYDSQYATFETLCR